jgi:hypothetical protein
MIQRIKKLSHWLFYNGFEKESDFVAGLTKESAGKPLPINRAEMDQIIDSLLADLKAKFLAYTDLGPFELYGVLAGQFALDDHKIPPMISSPDPAQAALIGMMRGIIDAGLPREEYYNQMNIMVDLIKDLLPSEYANYTVHDLERLYDNSKEQLLIHYLESNVTKSKRDIGGNEISVTYKLMFSDDPGKPPGSTAMSANSSEKIIILGFNPNSELVSRVQTYLQNNQAAMMRATGNRPMEIDFFIKSIRSYLAEVLRHEEVHAKDIISKDPRHGERYKVSNPNGETLEEIAAKLEIDEHPLFMINLMQIVSEANFMINPLTMMRAITEMAAGKPTAVSSMFNQIKTKKLSKDFELLVPPRAQSQIKVKVDNSDSLQSIADRTGVKHGAFRLLVVNFNHIFAPNLSLGGGSAVGLAPSYQHIYDLMLAQPSMKESLINTPLPENIEVKLVPSYDELYAYDRGFYLITREESKAHYEQIIYQVEEATKNMNPMQISNMSIDDMISLSSVATEYKSSIEVKPVDEMIKTPIGYLDKLKKDRAKVFDQRMYEHWSKITKI